MNPSNIFIGLILVYSSVAAGGEDEDTTSQLYGKPNKCIALRQGQDCYQTIRFRWTAIQKGDFCLVESGRETPLHCWENQSQGEFKYDFVAAKTQSYQLVRKADQVPEAETEITVNWVYTSKKRVSNGWKLF